MLKNSLSQAKDFVLDILFPPLCAVCERTLGKEASKQGICEACADRIPVQTAFTCPACRARLAENKKVCHKGEPFLLAAATEYGNDTVQKLIWKLKYEEKPFAAKPLAYFMQKHIKALDISLEDFTAVPIPLHRARERKRGFNQSTLLANILSKKLGIPTEERALRRVRATAPQAETKNRKERTENIAGCFAAEESLVSGKNILLIDDVCTSGETLREAARELKKAGAKHIVALVAAHA